jgi:hypothetical protein
MKGIHSLLASPKEFRERAGIVIGPPPPSAVFDETNPSEIRRFQKARLIKGPFSPLPASLFPRRVAPLLSIPPKWQQSH